MQSEVQCAQATVDDHLHNLIQLMKRGGRVSVTDIPNDPTFLSSHFGGPTAQAIAEKLEAALSAQVQDAAERDPKEIATWEDQQAFEEWAQGERYEMHQHPLHYLFMDPKTNAARRGWKAALQFIRDRSAAAPAKQEG